MTEVTLSRGETVITDIEDVMVFQAAEKLRDIMAGAVDTWNVTWDDVQRFLADGEDPESVCDLYELADDTMKKLYADGTIGDAPAIVGGEFSMAEYIRLQYEQMMLIYTRLKLVDGSETIGAYIHHIDHGQRKLYSVLVKADGRGAWDITTSSPVADAQEDASFESLVAIGDLLDDIGESVL